MHSAFRSDERGGPMLSVILLLIAAGCGYQLYHILSHTGDWFFGTTGVELFDRAWNVQIIFFFLVGLVCLSIAMGWATKKITVGLLCLLVFMGSGSLYKHNASIIKRPEVLPSIPGARQLVDGTLVSAITSGSSGGSSSAARSAPAKPATQGKDWNVIAKQRGYKRKTTANGKHIPLDVAGRAWCQKGGSHAALNAYAKAKGWQAHHLAKRKLDRDVNCYTGFQHYKAK